MNRAGAANKPGSNAKGHPTLRYIAVYKFLKAAGLILVALVAFGFVHEPWLDGVTDWVRSLPIQTGHAILIRWMDTLVGYSASRYIVIGSAAAIYGALFCVEGWGLWTGKRWAEYLTVFATASLIPFEAYEILVHPTWLKFAALLVNVAIVIYLWRIVHVKRDAAHA